ncbi:helix-turn-helix transcriptional regulator [Herbaspirillum sp. WKF16]|jgi:AraC-like DNA-binding protein/mannose-6-phosphate isomerase-like protein (cupin superfamily)|uniref:AraC family transcriptional regulator n=1 Tax=Herbaspirillum sp. WKF16 TaxID=3028312 RepID=UPI0023A92DCB|nr:helix-turn-helix transcriptional regulator [Herbaspirillum sp. WKF16]WDZ96985.1 helix-turn-helix transcriptional regulator [Herbaspirillum sp. WKF16]
MPVPKIRHVSPSREVAALQIADCAVVAFARELEYRDLLTAHSHRRGQLLYAVEGVMQVRTPQGVWLVPPQRALWVPPMVEHEIHMLSRVSMRTLYIGETEGRGIGERCRLLEVSVLLRELILALLAESNEYRPDSRAGHVAELIMSELSRAPAIPVEIPWPGDRRLVAICEAILAEPGRQFSLADWAGVGGASVRTVIRLFPKETGLQFRHWVQQVHLSEALVRLANGEAVGAVAQALGYKSQSAFSNMFRKALQTAPNHYLQRQEKRRVAVRKA